MAMIKYNLKDFDAIKAMEGALCVIVKSIYTAPEGFIVNIDNNGNANPNFIGAGICSYNGQDTYTVTIESKAYKFNEYGNGLYENTDCKIMLGTVQGDVSSVGNLVKSSISIKTTISTRGDDKTKTEVDYTKGSNVIIDNLNARDEFAIHALRELLCHIPDPSSVSDSEMNFYCDKAYRWAANMMSASANARGTFTNEGAKDTDTSNTDKADVPATSLTSNTEKLLNNIVAALEKTDYAEKDPTDSTKIVAYHERVKVQFTELIDFLKTYVKKDDKTNLGLKDLISTLENISSNIETSQPDYSSIISALNGIKNSLGNLNFSSDYSSIISAINDVTSKLNYLPSNLNQNFYNIGSSGLGRNKDNPLYISGGGGFPSRQLLASVFASAVIDSFLTFNTSGAVGYSTKDEVKKTILGWYNNYADLGALYNALGTSIDDRIKKWLAKVTVTVDNKSYSLNVPSSI